LYSTILAAAAIFLMAKAFPFLNIFIYSPTSPLSHLIGLKWLSRFPFCLMTAASATLRETAEVDYIVPFQ